MADKLPPPVDPADQLLLYRQAVDALGGIGEHARLCNFAPRTGRYFYAGARPVSQGILADTAKALQAHADLCRQLERKLSPDFLTNLTQRQREQDNDNRGRPRGPSNAGGDNG